MSTETSATTTRAPRREWTDGEIKSLRDSYSNKGAKFLAEKLGRDVASIYQKATKLGLKSASRMIHAPTADESTPKVRAYRRKTQLLGEAIVSKTAEIKEVSVSKQGGAEPGRYIYNVTVDGNQPVKMFANNVISSHSIVTLNIEGLRARCFVEDSVQVGEGLYNLKAVQTNLLSASELFELK